MAMARSDVDLRGSGAPSRGSIRGRGSRQGLMENPRSDRVPSLHWFTMTESRLLLHLQLVYISIGSQEKDKQPSALVSLHFQLTICR